MGNCGSTVDCNKCYSTRPIPGCETIIKVNPDIAGIGVLVSFFISAVSICLSIIWYYFRESLPSELLKPADHYVLRLLKKRNLRFDEADVDYKVSQEQERRKRTATGYLKVLGAQQLITGFSIIIAGLASRCEISFYEFNIVTSLAYLAALTHLCSLQVTKEYMYDHTTARTWRVIFTGAFAILLCFVYVINTSFYYLELDIIEGSDSLNPGNAVQCYFEAGRLGKVIQVDTYDSVTIGGTILVSHILAIGNLYVHSSSDFTTSIVYSIMAKSLRKSGLSKEDRKDIVYDSEMKYWAWLRPPRDGIPRPKMSLWWIIETYDNAELSSIPTMFGFFGYGICKIVFAVWYGGLKPSDELNILGFGQVAALGLLALTLISVIEIHDEERILHINQGASSIALSTHTSEGTSIGAETDQGTSEPDTAGTAPEEPTAEEESTAEEEPTVQAQGTTAPSSTNSQQPISSRRFLERLVLLGVPKSRHDLLLVKQNSYASYLDHPYVAARTALSSLLLFVFFTIFLLFIAIGWNFVETSSSSLAAWVLFIFYRAAKTAKRVCNQMYFVLEEVDARKHGAGSSRSSTAPILRHGSSAAGSSISLATLRSLPVHLEGESNLVRQGTEADMGLVPPMRRQTYPHWQE